MEENQPSAQAEQPQAPAEQAPAVNEGIQKRFDEMTARQRDLERQNQELVASILAQAAKQQQVPAVQAPPEADPLAQYGDRLDPTVQEAIRAQANAIKKQYEGIISQQQAAFSAQLSEMQVYTQAAQSGVQIPDEVKAKAAQIARQHNTSPDIALKLAYGEFALDQQKKVSGVRGYVPPNTPVITSAAPAPTQSRGPARPADFDDLDPRTQLQWLEKHGFEDSAF